MAKADGEREKRSGSTVREENIDLRAVLRTIRQPLIVLDGALSVERANAAFLKTFDTSVSETEGRKIYDLGNGQWDIPDLRRLLEEMLPENDIVTDYRVSHDFERIGRRVMLLNAHRMQREEGGDRILLTIDDITESERLRWELEAEKEYSEKIVDASRNAMLVLDRDLRVKTANETFYSNFRAAKAETEGRLVYDLGNGQWDIPRLRELLENVLPDNEVFNDFVVEHEFDGIGWRQMVLNARKIDHMHWILLEIEDQTEERTATALRDTSDNRFRALVSATTDVIYRMSTDWSQVLQIHGGGFLADTDTPESGWLETYVHPMDREAVSEAVARALETSEPFMMEHRVVMADGTRGWTASRAVPIRRSDGTIEEWLGVASDISARKEAEKALRLSEERKSFLLRLTDALRSLTGTSEIADVATRLLGEWLGASRAYFVEWPPGELFGEVFRDYSANGQPSLAGRYQVADFPSAHRRLSTGRTWVVPNTAAEAGIDADELRYYLDIPAAAWVDVPLVKNGELSAALCVVQDGPRDWTGEEVALVEDVAERCWAAIERGRAELQLEQKRERYAHIVAGARDYAIFTMDATGRVT
ncbi:PAS domain-containing protein, partial [Cribrihabitans sp. XS_ASV171]